MARVLFREVQYFRENPVWLILTLVPVILMSATLIYQLVTGQLVGDFPLTNMALTVLIPMVLVPTLLAIFRVKLTTVIDEEKISYGWNLPTSELNVILLAEIMEMSVIRYNFVGYGYRSSRKYGWVHNASGDKGLLIVKKNGEKVLIGTQRAGEVRAALESLRSISA